MAVAVVPEGVAVAVMEVFLIPGVVVVAVVVVIPLSLSV
jgi:hypothetical protein